MSSEGPTAPAAAKKARFGDMVVSEHARDKRAGEKFFDSADWVIEGKTSGHGPASPSVLESKTHENPTDSPLASTEG